MTYLSTNNQFSIVLPVKNGGNYVKECVSSILAQTYTDFNLVILDNNSTDGTLEWITALQDKRIIIYPSAVNLNIQDNWARIVTISCNEFMTCIGHDDLLAPHYLEVMDQLIKKYPDASLYQTHFQYINSKGDLLKNCKLMDELQLAPEFIIAHCLQSLDSTGTGYVMRSADYKKLGGIPTDYPGFIFADYELWISLILLSYKATAPEICFSYRINESASYFMEGEKYQKSFFHYLDFLKKVIAKDSACNIAFQQYGLAMFNYYCRSLSHRLLKSSPGSNKTSVYKFVQQCRMYAKAMIPSKPFRPLLKPAIAAAVILDNKIGRKIFYFFKSFLFPQKRLN